MQRCQTCRRRCRRWQTSCAAFGTLACGKWSIDFVGISQAHIVQVPTAFAATRDRRISRSTYSRFGSGGQHTIAFHLNHTIVVRLEDWTL